MSEENKRIVETLSHQNICLNELRQYIHQSFINAGGSKVKFSDTWLCDLVNDYIFPSPVVEDAQEEEPSDEFFKVFKHFIDARRASESRIKHLMVELRTFFIWAKDDYLKTDPFKNYEIGQCLYGTPFYPNLEERNKLYHFDFSGNPRLEVQRDIDEEMQRELVKMLE